MSLEELDNLIRSNILKSERGNQTEFDGLVQLGRKKLADAQNESLEPESQFDLAYGAAHAFSLAALRWHGYRPDNKRYVVFLALAHTLKLKSDLIRILDKSHSARNLAEYEGSFETDEKLLAELLSITKILQTETAKLGPIPPPSDRKSKK